MLQRSRVQHPHQFRRPSFAVEFRYERCIKVCVRKKHLQPIMVKREQYSHSARELSLVNNRKRQYFRF